MTTKDPKNTDELLALKEQEALTYRKELIKKEQELRKAQNELKRIKESNGQKVLQKCYDARERLFPFGSKRRMLGSIAGKIISNPKDIISKVNKTNVDKLIYYWHKESATELFERIKRYMKNVAVDPLELIINDMAYVDGKPVYGTFDMPKYGDVDVSIIIPVYNQYKYTYLCLQAIYNTVLDVKYEVILADDCSTDETKNIENVIGNMKVIHNAENLRFLKNCNNAVKYAKGKYILFLNNDTQVQPEWLNSLVELMESDAKIGMVGSRFVYPDGKLQEAGGIVWKDASAWNYGHGDDPSKPEYNYVKEVDYISGASIMIKSDLWGEIGGFDERFTPAYYEDSDLAFEVRKHGYKVMYQPKSIVVHFEGVSNGTDVTEGQKAYQVANREKFLEKWHDELEKNHFNNGENVFVARDHSAKRKTIVVVDDYIPEYDKDAGSKCTFMYLKTFVNMGFNVKFIGDNFYKSEPYTTTLEQMGIEVLYGSYYSKNWTEWIQANCKNINFAYLNRPNVSKKYIDIIKKNTNAKVIYFGVDTYFIRLRRQAEIEKKKIILAESEKYKKLEMSLFNKADIIYAVGSYEQQTLSGLLPQKTVRNIPVYIYPSAKLKERKILQTQGLLFVGGFAHAPNADGIKWFCKEIFPKVLECDSQIELFIAGSNPPEDVKELESNNIHILGFVKDDELQRLYNTCRMVVAPLRYGAGVKGKVVESQYQQIPLVTTDIGAEGLSKEENSFLIANDANGFAKCITDNYDNVLKLEELRENSVKFINNYFTEDVAKKILKKDFI